MMMMQLGFLLLIVPQLYAAISGLSACSALNGIANRASCQATGHCTWKSDTATCVDSECQKITEVAVCRTGLAGANLDFTSRCKQNPNYDFNYQNVCLYNSESSLRNGFLRTFKWTNITSTPTTTLTNIPATTLIATTEPQKYTYQLFTLDILLATNSELINILDGYLHAKNQIITDAVQPKFLEKAIFECLQNIRDDIALVDADRQITLNKIWILIDNLYMRYYVYKSQLIQLYNLVTFTAANLNRLSIEVPGVQNMITVSWDNTYSENGYMQIVSFAPEQFGITGIRSDIIVVTPIKISDFTPFTVPFTLKFEWTDSTADQLHTIFTFDRYTRAVVNTATTVACTAKVCALTVQYSTQSVGYFFSLGVPTICGSFSANAMLCRLNGCGTCS